MAADGYSLDIKNHTPEAAPVFNIELVNMLHDSFRNSDELLGKIKGRIKEWLIVRQLKLGSFFNRAGRQI